MATIELASYWPDCIKTLGDRFSFDLVKKESALVKEAALFGTGQLRCDALREREEPRTVPTCDDVRLAPLRELFGGVHADRVEQLEARVAGRVHAPDQALVDQGHEPVDHVHAELARRAGHRLGGRQVALVVTALASSFIQSAVADAYTGNNVGIEEEIGILVPGVIWLAIGIFLVAATRRPAPDE